MFKLKAEPTFAAKVAFPVAGGSSVEVELTFKHRTKSELDKWLKARKGADDVGSFMDMVQAWELEEDFTRANVEVLIEHHIGVAIATYQVYLDELTKHREKN